MKANLTVEELEELVRSVVTDTLCAQPAVSAAAEPARRARPTQQQRIDVERSVVRTRIADASPARLVQGRVGTRYKTSTYIGLRAEHAIAIDAVHSRVPDDFAALHNCIALSTQAKDLETFLLYPNLGRRLDDDSRARLQKDGDKNKDIQLILGDGLSAQALLVQAPRLLPALLQQLHGAGFSVGKPVFVRHARIGVQDDVGVVVQAKATVILVGERPGLGTGDSMSIYTAYAPKLEQDNAEKNCISNVRDLGLPAENAAAVCVDLLKKTFAAQKGGIHLVAPLRDVSKRVAL
jgi:ethanolamine ammonia-lyase small subunit